MMRKVMIVLFVVAYYSCALCQGPPPPMAMASEENQKLIDKIVEITNIKEYYNTTCFYYIDQAAKLNDWSDLDILKRKQRMDVNRFIRMNFYSFMARYSTEELEEIFVFVQKINKRNGSTPFFLINQSIESNLRLEISSIIE